MIELLLLAALQSAPGDGEVHPDEAPPVPIGSPGYWIGPADYPSESLRRGQQGTTHFRLTITSDGDVTHCAVTASSGYPLLDSLSCELLMERAEFEPFAASPNGLETRTYSSAVRWEIPDNEMTLRGGYDSFVVQFHLTSAGEITSCELIEFTDPTGLTVPPEYEHRMCMSYANEMIGQFSLPEHGPLQHYRITYEIRRRVEQVQAEGAASID